MSQTFAWSETTYFVSDGRMIVARVVQSGIAPDEFPTFWGFADITVKVGPKGGPMVNIDFPINGAVTIDDAVAMYREQFEAQADQLKARAQSIVQQKMSQQANQIYPGIRVPGGAGRGSRMS